MNKPLVNLVALQFKEFFREPEIIFWAFILPIVLSWLLGVAIGTGGGTSAAVAVIESAEAPREYWASWLKRANALIGEAKSRETSSREGTSTSDAGVEFLILTKEKALLALKKGEVSLYIERIPGRDAVRFSFDARNGEARMAYLIIDRALDSSSAEREMRNEVASLEIQGTRYIDFLVPGLLAMDIMSSALWGIGYALIEIRIKKLLRRMAATPMHKSMYLCSHFVTRLFVNALEFVALFAFVHFYFGVRIQGSVGALVTLFIAGNMAFAGLSILLSSGTANPRVANGLINAFTFPMMLLSGIFFSYHHFPSWAIPIVRKLPLTMLADSMRSVFNEGAGFAQVGPPAFVLGAMGVCFFSVGMRMYKWY